jgi:hypothetical protein
MPEIPGTPFDGMPHTGKQLTAIPPHFSEEIDLCSIFLVLFLTVLLNFICLTILPSGSIKSDQEFAVGI